MRVLFVISITAVTLGACGTNNRGELYADR